LTIYASSRNIEIVVKNPASNLVSKNCIVIFFDLPFLRRCLLHLAAFHARNAELNSIMEIEYHFTDIKKDFVLVPELKSSAATSVRDQVTGVFTFKYKPVEGIDWKNQLNHVYLEKLEKLGATIERHFDENYITQSLSFTTTAVSLEKACQHFGYMEMVTKYPYCISDLVNFCSFMKVHRVVLYSTKKENLFLGNLMEFLKEWQCDVSIISNLADIKANDKSKVSLTNYIIITVGFIILILDRMM
jgi:hypothetical protein